jgi:hypothetical protein
MTIVTFWVALGKVPLPAWTAKVNDPAAVGVPLKAPVVALSDSPKGIEPAAIDHAIGTVPVAVKEWL